MAWTNISVSVGQILTSTTMQNLVDNFFAVCSGYSGAPRYRMRAFDVVAFLSSVETSSALSANAEWTPPAGKYLVGRTTLPSGQISVLDGGVWYKSPLGFSQGSMFITDGASWKLTVSSLGGGSVYYNYIP